MTTSAHNSYGDLPEPYSGHYYWVEIQGITQAIFTECSGLQAELEIEDVVEGGYNEGVHRLPGRVKAAPNIVLKRGLANSDLWDWYYAIASYKDMRNTIARRNFSIILRGGTGQPMIRWEVIGALPIKWAGPSLRTGTSEIAVETVEFIHRGFHRA